MEGFLDARKLCRRKSESMIPQKLSFSGFGPYDHCEINFADLGPSIAMCAPKGTGKTFILEAMLIALYGEGAWYSDPYAAMTTNGTGSAEVFLNFTVKGKAYTVNRKFKVTEKTKSHRAWLYEQGNTTPIYGPKDGDTTSGVESLITSHKETVATRFLAQNRLGDLIATPGIKDLPALRRQIIFGTMNLEHLDDLYRRITTEAGGDDKLARELEAQLAGEPDPTEAIATAERELDQARVQKTKIETDLADAEKELSEARTALQKAQSGGEVHCATIDRHATAVKRRDELEKSLEDSKRRIAALKAIAETLPTLRLQIERLNNLKEEKEKLYKREHDFAARAEWLRRKEDIEGKLAAKRSTIATLEAVPGCDAETQSLAATVADVLAEYKKAEMENQARENRMQRRVGERTAFQRNLDIQESEITRLENLRATAPELPNDCTECPIGKSVAAEYLSIPAKLEELRLKADGYESQIEASIQADCAEPSGHDLAEIRERGQLARDAESKVNSVKDVEKQLKTARAELTTLEDSRATLMISEPAEVVDPKPELERVRKELDDLAGIPEKVVQANKAAEDEDREWIAINKIKFDLDAAKTNADELYGPAGDAQQAMDDLDSKLERLNAIFNLKRLAHNALNLEGNESISAIATLESQLTNLRERAAATAAKRTRLDAIRDRVEGFRDLQVCFGPKGAKQILIDSIAPQISDIADSLFDIATEGAMCLRIATQRATEKGGVQECFDILVRDHRGERPVPEGYSGGQLQLIRIIFRIAMALWVGNLYGRKPDWLILDEAFDALGREGSDQLLRVIEHLRDQFPFMLVVTHDPAIASRFPGQIYLTPRFGGVNVQVVGGRSSNYAK